jgi:hypothetical protein
MKLEPEETMPENKKPTRKVPARVKRENGSVVDLKEFKKSKPELSAAYRALLRETGEELEELAVTLFERAVRLAMAGRWKRWSDSMPEGTEAYIDESMLRESGDEAVALLLDAQAKMLEVATAFVKKKDAGKEPRGRAKRSRSADARTESPDDHVAYDDPRGDNLDLVAAGIKTARTDHTSRPMARARREIDLKLSFTPADYGRMCHGFQPSAMEDRWFIYEEEGVFYFHRSWSGRCIFTVRFEKRGARYVTAEAWASAEDGPQDDDTAKKTIREVIDRVLLGKGSWT